MITYPSTFGKFEEGIKEIIDIVHERGGQVGKVVVLWCVVSDEDLCLGCYA